MLEFHPVFLNEIAFMKMQTQQPRQPHPSEVQALQQLFQSGLLAQAEVRAQTLLANYPKALALYIFLAYANRLRVNSGKR